jgi:hypothetical protein
VLIEAARDVIDVVNVPGDRMEVLAEAIVEFLDRRVAQIFDSRGRHRLHDHVTDRDQ